MLTWGVPAPFFCVCAGYAMPCFDRGLYSACCAFMMILWARVRRPFVSSGSSSRIQLPGRIEQIGDPQLDWYKARARPLAHTAGSIPVPASLDEYGLGPESGAL